MEQGFLFFIGWSFGTQEQGMARKKESILGLLTETSWWVCAALVH
jgi:hypothetical protein